MDSCLEQFKLSLIEDYFNGPLVRSVGNALLESFLDDRDYDLIKMMMDRGFRLRNPFIQKCIRSYDVNIYKLLYPRYIGLTEKMLLTATKEGQVELLKWLIDNNCPGWRLPCYIFAASNDHLELIKSLRATEDPNSRRFTQILIHRPCLYKLT